MVQHGLTTHRALAQDYVSRSAFAKPGAFGRLFPTLPSYDFPRDLLVALDRKMLADSSAPNPPGGQPNETISAGYTFLGQFIDHDITFDPTSSLEKQNDPEAIHNFRTPLLELDSVYGSGPGASPHLYESEGEFSGVKLLIGLDEEGLPNDLPRNHQGTALIGDPRNDENLIVSQLHQAFLKFHNAVVDHLLGCVPRQDLFEEAQRVVRWHYQWIVVHEFLPRICGADLVNSILGPELGTTGQGQIGQTLDDRLKYIAYGEEPYIPVEFAVAAYRFGHSQVRPFYAINDQLRGPFFSMTRRSLAVQQNLSENERLLPDARMDWSRFFELDGPGTLPQQPLPPDDGTLQRSMRIDATISPPLFDLLTLTGVPADPPSLPFRNLMRGNTFRLPWGQRVAAAVRAQVLTDEQLGLVDLGFPAERAPLWYYILKEAEIRNQGTHLGEVGGRIVAEVLIGLLHGDRSSYLSHDPSWQPSKPITCASALVATTPGKFTVADLLRVAGVANPPQLPPPPTPSPTPTPTPTPPAPRVHVVEEGDTLWGIAERLLGNGTLWILIFEANRDKIDDPNLIHPGQELVIPDA